MADNLSPQQRSRQMSRIRGKNTRPEVALRSRLHAAGYRFRIHVKGMPGTPDIVFPGRRAVIMVHGCFWHRHEGCRYAYHPKTRVKFWREKFDANVRRDELALQALQADGWRVLTIWECELRHQPQAAITKARKFLDN